MTTKEQKRQYNNKYKQTHREIVLRIVRKGVAKYYIENKEEILDYKRKYYIYKKEVKRLLNIDVF